MEENRSTSEHVLRLSEYYNRLNQVGVNLPDKIVIDRVLSSLSPSYWNFVMNYSMQGMTKAIPETSDLVNHQHLMLFLDFYLRRFQHHEELGNCFRHPLHIIVHHEVLVAW